MSKLANTACPKCHGARHVPGQNGAWARCECVVAEAKMISYRAAGVDEVYLSGKTELYRIRGIVGANLKVDGSRLLIWLRGPKFGEYRSKTAAWVLRSGVDAGLLSRRVSLREGIEAKFDRDHWSDWVRDIETARVLVADLDMLSHKFIPEVLGLLWSTRSAMRATTVFVSEIDLGVADGFCGPSLSRVFASSKELTRLSTFRSNP